MMGGRLSTRAGHVVSDKQAIIALRNISNNIRQCSPAPPPRVQIRGLLQFVTTPVQLRKHARPRAGALHPIYFCENLFKPLSRALGPPPCRGGTYGREAGTDSAAQ